MQWGVASPPPCIIDNILLCYQLLIVVGVEEYTTYLVIPCFDVLVTGSWINKIYIYQYVYVPEHARSQVRVGHSSMRNFSTEKSNEIMNFIGWHQHRYLCEISMSIYTKITKRSTFYIKWCWFLCRFRVYIYFIILTRLLFYWICLTPDDAT